MKTKPKFAGVFIAGLTFLTFCGFIAMMIAPQEDIAESNGLSIVYVEDTDGKVNQPMLILADIKSLNADTISARVNYFRDGQLFSIVMEKLPGTDYYGAEIPGDDLGERNYYYLEAFDGAQNRVILPETASEVFESEYNYYKVRFEGKASFILLLFHIVLMIAAFFLLIHALYYALNYLATEERGEAIVRSVNLGIITFFITGFPIGWVIEKQVLGNYWEGIPFGWDITDSKTLIILVIWLIVIWLKTKNKMSIRTYAKWVIINTIITIMLFLLPHSL